MGPAACEALGLGVVVIGRDNGDVGMAGALWQAMRSPVRVETVEGLLLEKLDSFLETLEW
jgi:hypothetical protein